jgi:hypothetical protein
MLFSKVACLAAIAALFGTVQASAATVLTWTLEDITFASGQSATGSFSIDQAAGTLSDWKIQVSGGSNPSLTNLSFLPGANCVVFCGELFDAGNVPSPSGLDVRTGLMPDNTFFELNLYFNAPLSAVLQPGRAAITVNGGSHLDRALLVDPNTVMGLESDALDNAGGDARVIANLSAAPEPSSGLLLILGIAGIMGKGQRRHRGHWPF